jgi:hypothetical protein
MVDWIVLVVLLFQMITLFASPSGISFHRCVVFMSCLLSPIQLRGEFVCAVGSKGADVGQFNEPVGLALSPDETRLLVVDRNNSRVVVADATDGRWMRTLQGPAGTLVQPAGVAMVARTGQVLVVDWQHTRDLVVVFAGVDDDTVVRTLGDGRGHGPRQLFGPQGVAVLDEGNEADRPVAVVADTNNDRLSLFRVDDDTLLRHVGSQGAAPGQFNSPQSVSVVSSRLTRSDEAWLVVGDSDNHRVQVLTLLGVVVRVLAAGDGVGPLGDTLAGLTVCEATGEVLVSDTDNHRVVSWRLCDGGGCRVLTMADPELHSLISKRVSDLMGMTDSDTTLVDYIVLISVSHSREALVADLVAFLDAKTTEFVDWLIDQTVRVACVTFYRSVFVSHPRRITIVPSRTLLCASAHLLNCVAHLPHVIPTDDVPRDGS